MKEQVKRFVMALSLLLVCMMQFSIYADASNISNDIQRWGFKRGENNNQPSLDAKAKQIIDSFDGITIGNRLFFVGIISHTFKTKETNYLGIGKVINSKALNVELNIFLQKLGFTNI